MTDTTWTKVSEEDQPETKIVFDTIGDEFTGKYLGTRTVEPNDPEERPYTQARFETDEGLFFVNTNHSLRSGMKNVRAGSLVRLTYTDNLDTGQASPMRVFRVEVGRVSAGSVSRNT
jgi:hypothetical protein